MGGIYTRTKTIVLKNKHLFQGGIIALIHGKVTDFTGNPIADADVNLNNDKFKPLYSTKSDSSGNYKLAAKSGRYLSLFACKDYGTKNLEY